MSEQTIPERKSLTVLVQGDAKVAIALGAAAQDAIQHDQTEELHAAMEEFADLTQREPSLDSGAARIWLEAIALVAGQLGRAADALWYLAPEYDDGEEPE